MLQLGIVTDGRYPGIKEDSIGKGCGNALEALAQVIKELRDPETGCPWDIKQTHQSLKQYLIEECYEAIDAIDEGDDKLSEELGDVLLQVVLHAQIASERQAFSLTDIINGIKAKMIERHPHVFGDQVEVSSAEDVIDLWERNKSKNNDRSSILDGIPRSATAMQKAQMLGDKSSRIGFDWRELAELREKVSEELDELDSANNRENQQEELGDLLFVLAQYARKAGFDAEHALQKANAKFEKRFKLMETQTQGEDLRLLSSQELEERWCKAKKALK